MELWICCVIFSAFQECQENRSDACQGNLKTEKVPAQTEVQENFVDVFPVLPISLFPR